MIHVSGDILIFNIHLNETEGKYAINLKKKKQQTNKHKKKQKTPHCGSSHCILTILLDFISMACLVENVGLNVLRGPLQKVN